MTLKVTHSFIGDLSILLTSPSGTTSFLLWRPGQNPLNAFGTSQDNINFTFSTVLSLGERSIGTWSLRVYDNDYGSVGTLDSWTLNLIGKPDSADDVYIYTNEFAEAVADQFGRATLTDIIGTDTLNAAAVTGAMTINLAPGAVSTIDGRSLTIAASTTIENAIGGDGGDVIHGNAADNVLRGVRGDDSLDGGDGNDRLIGGPGNDTFDWDPAMRGGADTMEGGPGDDTYVLSTGDRVVELANEGVDIIWSFINASLMDWPEVENLFLFGTSAISAVGNEKANRLRGNDLENTLSGLAGSDNLDGGAGNDSLTGGGGDDYLTGGLGADAFVYDTSQTSGTDSLTDFANGNDAIVLNQLVLKDSVPMTDASGLTRGQWAVVPGPTSFFPGATTLLMVGTDSVPGADLTVSIWGTFSAGAFSAGMTATASQITYAGQVLTGTAGKDTLEGGVGTDTLQGEGGDDSLAGGPGNDLLNGWAGSDTLTGGEGNDSIYGGDGTDTAVFVGSRKNYSITWSAGASAFTVTSSAEGTDTLTGIETLTFADGPYAASTLQNNTAPTLSTVSTLSGAVEDTAFLISWAALAAAADEADAQGDPIAFRVEAVSSGVLTKNGVAVTPGSTTLTQGEVLTWTPSANSNGTLAAFQVRALDASLASAVAAQVSVSVAAVNDAPVVATPLADSSVALGSSLNFSFGSTAFTDVETANLTYTATRADGSALPAWLSFSAGTRTFSGTPASGDIGTLSIKISASDGNLSASDTFDVVVSQRPNTAPVAANATGSTSEDTALTASLPAATDGESDTVTYAKATNPGKGTATVTTGGSYTYTPTANYSGPDSFTYTVSDGQGGSNTYTVNLTVTAVNDTPVATGGSSSTTEDTQATGTLSATDVDNASLSYAVVSRPANGSVVLGANGAYSYTPAANFNGSDSFTFKANDGSADSNTATVTITVAAVNDTPVVATPLADRSVTLGSSLNFSFGVSAFTDVETANLTYTATRADGSALPAWLSFNAGTRTFSGTPASGDIGTVSVKVTASDGSLSASDVFDVVVSLRPNTAPVAANATGSTSEDTALTASLPAATDGESDPVTYSKATNPSNGTASVTSGGSYTYTPTANYSGPDSFSYTVSDSQGGSNTYTVSLTVNAVNDIPVATGGSLSTAEDTQATGTLTATDGDNANLSYAVVSQPANGSVVLGGNGSYTYTPAANFNGSDSFTFKASDGGADSNTATVTITVSAVNDAPVVATPLTDRSVTLGSSLSFSFGASAFTDVETANLTYTATRADGSALPAWLSFSAGTRTFSGTPASSDLGTVSVKVTASDGSLSASDTFDVVVSPRPNTAPVAANAMGNTNEDTALTAGLPAATDGESDTVTYAKATNPVKGTATVTAGGSYTYTPATNYNGPDSFTYTVSDAKGSSNTYTVSLTVNAVNDAPVATGGSLSATEDTQATGTLLATDVDNASLTYAVVSKPANGSVVLGAGGAFTYTSSANFNGSDSFTFKANDGSADSNTATVSITVAAVNDAPVVVTPLADRSVTLGSSLNFSFGVSAFTDVETANLTYTATRADGSALPAWLSFTAGTRTFSGTPASGDIGTVSVKVTASDGSLSASDNFGVTVAEVQRPVSGVVQDGYVAGASIFVDRNGNGLPDAGEDTSLRTDSSGNFTGTISGTGNLIAVGGTNIDTGLRNTLTLTAPQGATVISPVTTLVQTLVSTQALTPTQAQQKVAQAFGIDSATDLLRFDPLASTGSTTSTTALAVQKANAQVALTAGLVENTTSVISGLAQVVAQASTPVDLSKATTLAQVTSGLNVSTAVQTTIAQGNALVQSSTSLSSVAEAQKTTVTTALPSTTDWTAPTVSSFSPADGAAGVVVSSNLTLSFSEPVQRGSGSITLRRADGTVVEQFDSATSNRLTLQGSTLTLDPSADLAGSTGFYLEVSPGVIKDLAGNGFIGSSNYDFSTQSQAGDVSAPTATKWGPADGAKAVPVGANLAITFNELIQAGTGPITLKTADGKVVETFTAANATVSGSTLTLNPTADLSIFTKYVVELRAGAVKDLAGNGNAADSRYDFQTATQDGLYHFFVVAFAAAPGATYMGQLAEAVNYGLSLPQIVEIFTTKKQFTDVYPTAMSNRDLATLLVNNIVKASATEAARNEAISDIETVLSPEIGWSRGKMLYTVFGNLASKPLTDATWGGTAQQFQNQLVVARYFTEQMGVETETLTTLRGVIGSVTPDTDVSTVDKIVQIIGTIPPGG